MIKIKSRIRRGMEITAINGNTECPILTELVIAEETPDAVPASKAVKKSLNDYGAELLDETLTTIQKNLRTVPFFADKEYDVHPFYKFVFQEVIKHHLKSDDEDNYQSSATIGIEGFDITRL